MRNAVPRIVLFGPLSVSLSLFLPFYLLRGCARLLFFFPHLSFFRSIVLSLSLASLIAPPAPAFRARFIPTRPCGNVSSTETAILGFFSFGLFLASSNFPRVSNIGVIFQRAKIPRENRRAVRIKHRCSRDQYRNNLCDVIAREWEREKERSCHALKSGQLYIV